MQKWEQPQHPPCEMWDTNWARSWQPTARVVLSRDVSSSLSSTRSSWQLLSTRRSEFSRQKASAGQEEEARQRRSWDAWCACGGGLG
jgi:hypothetical protein